MADPPDATRIDPRESERSWERPTEDTHIFQFISRRGFVLEVEDLHFHHDSAVLLPDYEPGEPDPEAPRKGRLNGLAVLRAAYLHAKENPDRLILVAGHTDTSGKKPYNRKLSSKRAENVLCALAGKRRGWVEIALKKGKVEDYQQIVKWIARTWGWNCDPGKVDDLKGPLTKSAVEVFQAAYNKKFSRSIGVDGAVGRDTWGALFDVFMQELCYILETDEAGLKDLRARLKFVDDGHRTVGCGESFPIDQPNRDRYRSRTNRRVEILFFEPDQKPVLTCKPGGETCKRGGCEINDIRYYSYEHLECDPVPTLAWVDLQTVDDLGAKVGNVSLQLKPTGGDAITIKTDKTGYWSGRLSTAGPIPVTLADGTPVRFASKKTSETPDQGKTAEIDPRVAPECVTDLVVPGVSAEDISHRDEMVRRYGAPRPNGTVRGGGRGLTTGEKAVKISSRGGEEPSFTRRAWHALVADNLMLAAGWKSKGKSADLDGLLKHLGRWLADRHPTAKAREFVVTLILGSRLELHSADGDLLGKFDVAPEWRFQARYGAYSWFETNDEKGHIIFRDMNTASVDLVCQPAKEGASESAIDPEGAGDRSGARIKPIWEVLPESQQQRYLGLLRENVLGARKVHVIYVTPESGWDLYVIALQGGTGLLENYPKDPDVNEHVHERNVKVVRNSARAYMTYIRNQYIPKVKKAKSHKDLHALGPPHSPFHFPMPAGTTKDQRLDLYKEDLEASSFEAWQAIGLRLEELFGMIPEGTIFIKFDFSADTGNMLGPFTKFQAKWNFTAGTDGKITVSDKVETSKTVTVGIPDSGLNHIVAIEEETTINEFGKKVVTHKAKLGVGPYGFETELESGKTKMSYGGAFAEGDPKAAVYGYGVEFSLRERLWKRWMQLNPGQVIPDWIKNLPPDFKLSVGLFFQSLTVGTVLAYTSKAPGFFERRPYDELIATDWRSLDWDEQQHLKELGWNEFSVKTDKEIRVQIWDRRRELIHDDYPKSAQTDFYDLTAKEKIAAVHLGLPARDPYWQQSWMRLAKRPPPQSLEAPTQPPITA